MQSRYFTMCNPQPIPCVAASPLGLIVCKTFIELQLVPGLALSVSQHLEGPDTNSQLPTSPNNAPRMSFILR